MATQDITLSEETSQEARFTALAITTLLSGELGALLGSSQSAVLEEATKILYELSRGSVKYSPGSIFSGAMVYQSLKSCMCIQNSK